MELNNEAKQKLIGATIIRVDDDLIHLSNGNCIVLTEEEIKSLNN